MDFFYTGSLVGDYLFCKRKFYLITKGISPDGKNEDLIIGQMIDRISYPREERNILLGKNIIDFVGPDGKIHEIKKSSAFIENHIIQLKFYLLIYKKIYNREIEGVLNFPEEKKVVDVKLEEGDEEKIKNLTDEMKKVEEDPNPPELSEIYKCKKCSYLLICRS
ncbi:MAG: CRISPR-associated protein Cas4 [candidate division WOR-3 bacterium]